MRPGADLGIQITIFRPQAPPAPQRWFRRLWRKLPVHRAPPELGVPLFKAMFDARMIGGSGDYDLVGLGCRHDVCFEQHGGVIAGNQRYLGFTIVPDVIDVDTIIQDKQIGPA